MSLQGFSISECRKQQKWVCCCAVTSVTGCRLTEIQIFFFRLCYIDDLHFTSDVGYIFFYCSFLICCNYLQYTHWFIFYLVWVSQQLWWTCPSIKNQESQCVNPQPPEVISRRHVRRVFNPTATHHSEFVLLYHMMPALLVGSRLL